MASKIFACVAVMVMVAISCSPAMAAVTCGTVTSSLAPCIPYARRSSAAIPSGCCTGISNLNNAAKTTADRQTACRCLQSAANAIKGLDFNLIAGLPGKCKVNIPYKISPSTNCNSIR